jgi:hypothetical protein
VSDEEAQSAAADPSALLVGAAAIEPGLPPPQALEQLAAANPNAAARTQENARLQQERETAWHELLRTRFGVEFDAANGGPLIPAERHFELARTLKLEFGYRMYVTCCASHWPAAKSKSGEDPEH